MMSAADEARRLLAHQEPNGNWPAHRNAELIAAAPALIAELLAERDALAAEVKRRTDPTLAGYLRDDAHNANDDGDELLARRLFAAAGLIAASPDTDRSTK
jgi:hypothetical protein